MFAAIGLANAENVLPKQKNHAPSSFQEFLRYLLLYVYFIIVHTFIFSRLGHVDAICKYLAVLSDF